MAKSLRSEGSSPDVWVPMESAQTQAVTRWRAQTVHNVPPGDISNIEVSRNSQVPANPLEVTPLHRFTLDALADLGKRVRELAETMIGLAGRFHVFRGAGGQLDWSGG